MRNHTKVYFKFFEIAFDESGWHDYIPCEMCGRAAVDIHHIENRGMGGGKEKDKIENLMALCRECHNNVGDIISLIPKLKAIHLKKVELKSKSNVKR